MSGIVGTSHSKSKVIGRSQDTAFAWAHYNQDSSAVRNSFGLSSITDTATGKYTCIFSKTTGTTYYAAVGMADGGYDVVFGHSAGRSTTQCEIRSLNVNSDNYEDNGWNSIIFFGDSL